MTMSIEEYAEEFVQETHARVEATGTLFPDAFFEMCTDMLVDAGEIEEAERAYYTSDRGIRVDGYGGDPWNSEGRLTLFSADWIGEGVESLTQTDMDKHFRRMERFIQEARDRTLVDNIEESNPVWYLANLIRERWAAVNSIRLVILTNRRLSRRVDGKDSGEIDGIPVSYSVWDLDRFHRFTTSTRERDSLEINFVEDFGRGIPALEVAVPGSDYKAYLAAIPAEVLSGIYDRWGARLLEQNVRVYLQARSKVNQGILTTISDEPHMFFAYNNGISATASSVGLEDGPNGKEITSISDLQIVNGAQTTASVHRARKTGDLSLVTVQMKLSVIEADRMDIAVPKISRYANSQNRISEADFFSNHPFHVRIEELSRRLFTPSRDGAFQQSKWFYERARGQYQSAKADLVGSERRKFEVQFPRQQMFSKTDLAKFINVWRERPHVVSQGAQKNFKSFADHVAEEWEKNKDGFGEAYFQKLVAQALVFRMTERLVSNAPWYKQGYRANIVAYSISKVAQTIREEQRVPDFENIWQRQEVPVELERVLLRVGEIVSDILMAPPAGTANISEWAKKAACWTLVQAADVSGVEVHSFSISREAAARVTRTERKDTRMIRGIEAQTFVFDFGANRWNDLLEWGMARRALSPKEIDILRVCLRPDSLPSERQCEVAIKALLRLHQKHGCTIGEEEIRASAIG